MSKQKIKDIIVQEEQRLNKQTILIASENYTAEEVYKAMGTRLTDVYAEGYPGKRYYNGCENVDSIETIAQDELMSLFDCAYCNVQPHSGSNANLAVQLATTNYFDGPYTIVSLGLNDGGHLTHGFGKNVSGMYNHCVNYKLTEDGLIDYDHLESLLTEYAGKLKQDVLLIMGGSAYSRIIDFERVSKFIKDNNLGDNIVFQADISHFAGMVAGGNIANPMPFVDVMTSTTHKTLNGPRGGVIMWNDKKFTRKLNSAVFPGCQGGPLMHVIAAKGICFADWNENQQDKLIEMNAVIKSAQSMANKFIDLGYDIVSGGTDTHLFLLDVKSKFPELSVDNACIMLEDNDIVVNKNLIPGDTKPLDPSGMRIGTPYMISREGKDYDFELLAEEIDSLLCQFNEV